jgi:hypothetical protein
MKSVSDEEKSETQRDSPETDTKKGIIGMIDTKRILLES